MSKMNNDARRALTIIWQAVTYLQGKDGKQIHDDFIANQLVWAIKILGAEVERDGSNSRYISE